MGAVHFLCMFQTMWGAIMYKLWISVVLLLVCVPVHAFNWGKRSEVEITTTLPDGTVEVISGLLRDGDYEALQNRLQAVEMATLMVERERLALERMRLQGSPCGELPQASADQMIVNAYANCIQMQTFQSLQGNIPEIVTAATGNPTDDLALAMKSDNAVKAAKIQAAAQQSANRWKFATALVTPLTYYALGYGGGGRDTSGNRQSIGDHNTFNFSNAGGSASAGGRGSPSGHSIAQRQISVFGDTGQGFLIEPARSGLSFGGHTLVNDVSGTMGFDLEKGVTLADEVGAVGEFSDDDGFNF